MVECYLRTLQSENTRKAYSRDLGHFSAWLDRRGKEVSSLRPRDLAAYRADLQAEFEPATVNRRLASARSYLRWLVLEEVVAPEVLLAATSVGNVKEEVKLPRLLSEQELDDLTCTPDVATLDGSRDLVFILLLATSGVRLNEAVQLDRTDVLLSERKAIVRGKGAKERVVFFNQATEAALTHYLRLRGNPSAGPLLVNKDGARVSPRWMQSRLAEYGARIGRPDLHPHLLRHCFGTELLDRTGDLDLVRRLLGHSSPTTTQRYVAQATRRIEAVYREAMDGREGIGPVTTAPARRGIREVLRG